MSPIVRLSRIGGAWIRHDAASPGNPGGGGPAPETFVLGTTQPTAANTGPRIADVNLSNYAGSFTNLRPGETVRGLAITGVITMSTGDGPGVFEDCLIQYGQPPVWPPSGSTVNTYRGASVFGPHNGVTFNFCEFRPDPAYLSYDTYGIQGGDMTIYRCHLQDGVDGIVGQGYGLVNGVPGPRRTVRIYGNYIERLRWYSNDPGKGPEGSHSDGIVGEGNADFEAIGNTVDQRYSTNGQASCIFVNNNVPGNYTKVLISDNWLYPIETTSYATASSSINIGATPCNNLTIIRNRIKRPASSTLGRIYVKSGVRSASTTDLGLSGGGTGTPVAGRCNVYMDDGSPYPISNG